MVKTQQVTISQQCDIRQANNWEIQEKRHKSQYGYRSRLKGDWNQGYVQTLRENTRYFPEALYDNYITYLENNGFMNSDGTMKTINNLGEEIPTLEQFAEMRYETDELDDQNSYELDIGEIKHERPPIEVDEEED